ncbi:DEAD-box ATP-dependent RNA helicase 39 [Morus notabilis]|nr:DEAD-box ATP-dependent RNA helicase 39 [Morus notabilis]
MVLPQKPISYKEMNEAKLASFRHLGVGQRLTEAVKELGILFPAEIHCAGIPPILKGKSLVLTSHNESVGSFTLGVLTYLLPLIQLLTVVKFLLKPVKSKTTVEDGQLESNVQEDASDASVGLLVTTPGEVLQKIEEGSVVPNEIRYLVFDEVDDIFNHGLGPEIQKFLSPLKEHASNSNDQSVQTILVTSMITKVLREDLSSLVEHLESSHAEVAAITVEIDQTEAFHLLESPEALKKKAEEVVHSLQPSS